MPFFWNPHSKAPSDPYSDEVEGVILAVQLKLIRHMYLRVASVDGPVRVSAPVGTSREAIRRFAQSRLDWIASHRARLARKLSPSTGRIFYLGKLVEEAELCGDIPPQGRTAVLQARFRRELHDILVAYLETWQPRLNLYASSWHMRQMTSRWGSCNTATKRLCFNTRLIRCAPECIEYVVVHELAHLAVPGHNPRFWALVGSALPDWQRRRQMMRQPLAIS